MDTLHTLDIETWTGPFAENACREAIAALESGMIVYLPKLAFALDESERPLLSPALLDGRGKNIAMDPDGALKHAARSQDGHQALRAMMQRFARNTTQLIGDLFPNYVAKLERARTSYRPAEIEGRRYSPLDDDTRLHIDAFPTRPMQKGRRILRLFTNLNPNGAARVWRVGEPFEDMAQKLLPNVFEPMPVKAWFLAAVGATKGRRSLYDEFMLGLHNEAKLNAAYQKDCPKTEIAFPSGATWVCYTDQVMHAALSGQHVLEQTFHLDIDAMAQPKRAPVKVLERLTRRPLG